MSVACLLSITAGAKLYSATGHARLLDIEEALLPMSIRQALWLIGFIELAIVVVLLVSRSDTIKLVCIAWLAGNFALYRIATLVLAVGKPCPCLGSITERLHLKQATVEHVLVAIVAYMLFGSLFFLIARLAPGSPHELAGRKPDGGVATLNS